MIPVLPVLKYDEYNPVIGSPWDKGYRITFDIQEHYNLMNWLSDNLGEGVVQGNCIKSENWILTKAKATIWNTTKKEIAVLLVPVSFDLSLLIKQDYEVKDTTQKVIGTKLEQEIYKIVQPHMFKKITPKLHRRLRQEIANYLHKAWYNISLVLYNGKIEIYSN